MNDDMTRVYLECECGGLNCITRMYYFKDDRDYLYIETYPNRWGFFRRIWIGLKYILGIYEPHWDVVWTLSEARKFQEQLNVYLNGG